MQRPSPRMDADKTIQQYRRRRSRTMPVLFAGLAVVLLVGAVVLLVSWLSGDSPPTILATATPTPTLTATPVPPTATPDFTDTPTATPTEAITPTPTRPFTYTVELGDTLFDIAERFDLDVLTLMAANGITDAGTLYVGQELVIPPAGAKPPTATPLPENLRPGTKIPYTVQAGDNLQNIAARFNSTADAIAKENKIDDPNNISVGQLLTIPVNIVTPTPTLAPTITATP